MASSWDSYYVVFLSGVLSLGVPLMLALISFVFFPKNRNTKQQSLPSKKSQSSPQGKLNQSINVRFFLAANAALVLIALALELIPCAATIQSGSNEFLLKGLISVISLAGFAALGLTYAAKKGNMTWLPSSYAENSKDIHGD